MVSVLVVVDDFDSRRKRMRYFVLEWTRVICLFVTFIASFSIGFERKIQDRNGFNQKLEQQNVPHNSHSERIFVYAAKTK